MMTVMVAMVGVILMIYIGDKEVALLMVMIIMMMTTKEQQEDLSFPRKLTLSGQLTVIY